MLATFGSLGGNLCTVEPIRWVLDDPGEAGGLVNGLLEVDPMLPGNAKVASNLGHPT